MGIATGNPQQLEQTLGVAQTAETKPEFFVFARPDRPVIALVANAGPDSGVPYFCDFASGRKLRTGSIRPEDVKAPITARACIRINGVDYRSPETVVFARDRADPSALLITVNGETMRVRNSPSRSAENESKGFDR